MSYCNLRILNLIFLNTSIGSNIIVSKPVLVIPNIAEFHTNLSIIVLHVFLSSTLIIVNHDISSINGASTFISLCLFGFNTMHSFGKICMDPFKKLEQQSCEFITASNSNIFLIPKKFHVFLILRYLF